MLLLRHPHPTLQGPAICVVLQAKPVLWPRRPSSMTHHVWLSPGHCATMNGRSPARVGHTHLAVRWLRFFPELDGGSFARSHADGLAKMHHDQCSALLRFVGGSCCADLPQCLLASHVTCAVRGTANVFGHESMHLCAIPVAELELGSSVEFVLASGHNTRIALRPLSRASATAMSRVSNTARCCAKAT